MADVASIASAVDGVIDALDQEKDEYLASYDAERARLVGLRQQALSPVASTPADGSAPMPGGQTDPPRFGAVGKRKLRDVEIALQKGPKTTGRLRDLVGTTEIGRYLQALEAEGKARPNGEMKPTPGRKMRRKSPVWEWCGPDSPPRRAPRVGPSVRAVVAEVLDNQKEPFSKSGLIKGNPKLTKLNEGSVQDEFQRLEKVGRIRRTGNKIPSPVRGTPVPEFEVVHEPQSAVASPVHHVNGDSEGQEKDESKDQQPSQASATPAVGPGEGERFHSVHVGDGLSEGRLRAPTPPPSS